MFQEGWDIGDDNRENVKRYKDYSPGCSENILEYHFHFAPEKVESDHVEYQMHPIAMNKT